MFQGVITVKSDGSKWRVRATNADRAWDSICHSRVTGSIGDSVTVDTLDQQGKLVSRKELAHVRKII